MKKTSYREKEKDPDLDSVFRSSLYKPKTVNQGFYVHHLDNPHVRILFGVGPAGSGKTLFACSKAIQEYQKGNVDRIVLTRPLVSVEEELGFLPGSIFNKMEPWTRPIFDVFHEYCSKKEVDLMLKNGVIEISPLAYMRGRTFKRAVVIADEMQNSSPNQMLMLLTRVGEESKLIVTGDLKQSDLALEKSGLHDFIGKWKSYSVSGFSPSIQIVEFNHSDVFRSPVVSLILDVYNKTDIPPPPPPSTTPTAVAHNAALFIKQSVRVNANVTRDWFQKPKNQDDAALIPIWDISKNRPLSSLD